MPQINSKGFGLIEAVVSLTLISIIGITLAGLLTRTFQSNTKSSLVSDIKQSADNIFSILTNQILNSDEIICVSPDKTLFVTKKDSVYTSFKFYSPSVSPPKTNGYIALYPLVANSDYTQSLDNFLSRNCNPLQLSKPDRYCPASFCQFSQGAQKVSISDTNPQSGISINNAVFTLNQPTGNRKSLSVDLFLKPPINAGNSIEESLSSPNGMMFTTTIQPR